MRQSSIRIRQQYGLTLVELMIGLIVGMLVIGAVLYVFLGSRLTYKYNDTMGRLQENGRIATEMIGQDLRMTGFIGCRRLAAYLRAGSTGSHGDVLVSGIEKGSDFSNAIASGVGVAADKLDLADTGFVFTQTLPDQVLDTDSLTVLTGSAEIRLAAEAINNIVTDSSAPRTTRPGDHFRLPTGRGRGVHP
ncbi:PilW family protein [Thauera sp. SDU_THAU2]|uniref:PilW family protein n=1 Tax=Thauera sp. SDU_THAU2 TaxID=3136633 RepID=UPI00311D4A0F